MAFGSRRDSITIDASVSTLVNTQSLSFNLCCEVTFTRTHATAFTTPVLSIDTTSQEQTKNDELRKHATSSNSDSELYDTVLRDSHELTRTSKRNDYFTKFW